MIKKELELLENNNGAIIYKEWKENSKSEELNENATENVSSNARCRRFKYNMISSKDKAKALKYSIKYGLK